MAILFANSGDPNQMPHSAASDLGLHCLPNTLLGVSRLLLVNQGMHCLQFILYFLDTLKYHNNPRFWDRPDQIVQTQSARSDATECSL